MDKRNKGPLNLSLTTEQLALLQAFVDSGTDGIITLRDANGGKSRWLTSR